MNEFVMTKEILLILSPLILLHISLVIYCGLKIFSEGVKNLSKWTWLCICLLISVIGPTIFLLAGRKKEYK